MLVLVASKSNTYLRIGTTEIDLIVNKEKNLWLIKHFKVQIILMFWLCVGLLGALVLINLSYSLTGAFIIELFISIVILGRIFLAGVFEILDRYGLFILEIEPHISLMRADHE